MVKRASIGGGVLGICLLAMSLLAPSAFAAQAVSNDPAGDGHGSGDILALKVYQAGGMVVFQVRTPSSVNLHSPAWTFPSATQLRFNVDNNHDTQVDYAVVITTGKGGPSAQYVNFNLSGAPRAECGPEVFKPQPTIIRATVPDYCFSGPLRTFARYRFDQGGNSSIDSDDRAPDVGYGGAITLLQH